MREETTIFTVSKGPMSIPKAIQARLGLKPGDRIRYSVKGNKVEIEKLSDAEEMSPFSSLTEWDSEADEKAFGQLKPKKN